MFNRTLQVDVVKKGTNVPATVESNDIDFESKITIVVDAVERGIMNIGLLVGAYVVLDTVRKVAIESAKK